MAQSFSEEYDRLNTEQRRAVDAIDGPLLVIAGPGTGKTQLISARAANILQQTDTDPSSILCLTFTDKAATNLRERLIELIGPEARKIAVHTFHALGAEIINSYPDYFWSGAKLEPAPDAVRLEIIEAILSALPLKNPLALKFAGQNTLTKDVDHAIKRAKEAGLTPVKLRAVLQANLSYIDLIEEKLQPALEATISKNSVENLRKVIDSLPDENTAKLTAPIEPISLVLKQTFDTAYAAAQESGKNTPVSEWKKQWSQTENKRRVLKDRSRSAWWLELASVYEAYQEQMSQRGYFDYADMILEAISQLENQPILLNELQERYLYLMIDEFQDTNDAQFRLSYLIASHGVSEGKPNIMAVGDDDQAIYRFQGATLSNFRQFMDTYGVKAPMVLTKNYRSHQSVLDAAATVAEKIDVRLVKQTTGLTKQIVAAERVRAGQIEHFSYPTQLHELSTLAERIKHEYTEVQGEEVAVLARQHASLEQLAYMLTELNVPVRYERKTNVLENPAVKLVNDLLSLLEYIHTGNRALADVLLPHILAHSAWEIEPTELWRLATANAQHTNWLESLLNSSDKQLKQIGNWLTELAAVAQQQPLVVTIEHLLGLRELNGFVSPLRKYFIAERDITDQYVRLLSALRRLRQLASEFAKNREPTLEAFNNFIRLNIQQGIVIADESVFTTGERAVELMTVHKAKGLEFETVYLIDAVESEWQPRKRRRTPPSNLETLQEYGEDADDYARLFYVASTRAKRNLYIASYGSSESGTKVLPTPFAHDAAKVTEIKLEDCPPPVEVLESASRFPMLDHADARHALTPILENYQLSVTGLLNFLDITRGGPQYFFERNILRLPEVKTSQLAFGSAIHDALEYAQHQVNKGNLNLPKVLATFEKSLASQQMSETEETRYREHGAEMLERLFKLESFSLPKGSQPERALREVSIGDARLSGKLDRIDTIENGIHIVDYKTGKPLSSITTQSKTDGAKAWRHRTQLIFYALLAREKQLAKADQTITAGMWYVEAEKAGELERSYEPSREDLDKLANIIQSVWRNIMDIKFPDTTRYSQDLDGILKFETDLIEGKV